MPLGRMANDRAHVDFVVVADFALAGENGMGENPSAATDARRPLDYHIRADVGLGVDLGARVNQCGRMDGHGVQVRGDLRLLPVPLRRRLPLPVPQEYDILRPPKLPGRSDGTALNRRAGRGFLAREPASGRSDT